MKLIFLIFKSRYRYKDIGNFIHSKVYNNFFLINLSGPLKSILGRFLVALKIGRGISLDGNPIIKNKSDGINIWFGGTSFKIPEKLKYLKNNYVNVKNIIFPNDNFFQFYPINIKNFIFKKDIKIIFASKIQLDLNNQEKLLWAKYKKKILTNFLLIDKLKFWKQKDFLELDQNQKFLLYRKFKNSIKYESIKYLKKKFNKNLWIIGSDWRKYKINSFLDNYEKNYITNMYQGNICLDFGSMSGSTSLYPRSIRIIESGGLLIQAKQLDYNLIWSADQNKILFNSVSDIFKKINFFYESKENIIKMINSISSKFKNTEKIDLSLKKIFS